MLLILPLNFFVLLCITVQSLKENSLFLFHKVLWQATISISKCNMPKLRCSYHWYLYLSPLCTKVQVFCAKFTFGVSKCLMRNKSFHWEMYHNNVTMLTIPSFNYPPLKIWGNLRHVNFFFVVVWHNLAPQFLKLFWHNNVIILHLPKAELFYYIMKVLGHVRNISFTIAAYFLLQI